MQLVEKGVPVVQAVQVVQACRDAVFVSLMVQTSRRTIEIPQVIRGLHAAGELAGRVFGSRLGGNSLLDYAVLCVAMSSGGESFSPDDAYDSAWDSVMPTKGNTLSITSSTKTLLGVFACSRTGSAAVAFLRRQPQLLPVQFEGHGSQCSLCSYTVQVCGETVELPQLHLLAAWLRYIGMVVDVPVVWGMRGSSSTR